MVLHVHTQCNLSSMFYMRSKEEYLLVLTAPSMQLFIEKQGQDPPENTEDRFSWNVRCRTTHPHSSVYPAPIGRVTSMSLDGRVTDNIGKHNDQRQQLYLPIPRLQVNKYLDVARFIQCRLIFHEVKSKWYCMCTHSLTYSQCVICDRKRSICSF